MNRGIIRRLAFRSGLSVALALNLSCCTFLPTLDDLIPAQKYNACVGNWVCTVRDPNADEEDLRIRSLWWRPGNQYRLVVSFPKDKSSGPLALTLRFYNVAGTTWFEVRGDGKSGDRDAEDNGVFEMGEGMVSFPTPDRMELRYLETDRVSRYADHHPKELSTRSAGFLGTQVVATPSQWIGFLNNHIRQPGWMFGPMVFIRKQ